MSERDPTESLSVREPCPMRWSELHGAGDVRDCASCAHTVHDISAVTRAQARAFLRGREGRTCVTFVRRPDGSPWFRGERWLPEGMTRRAAAAWLAAAGLAACAADVERGAAAATDACASDASSEHVPSESDLEVLRMLGYVSVDGSCSPTRDSCSPSRAASTPEARP